MRQILKTPIIISVATIIFLGTLYYFVSNKASENLFERHAECAKAGAQYDEKFRKEHYSYWLKARGELASKQINSTLGAPSFFDSEYTYNKNSKTCVFYGGYRNISHASVEHRILVNVYTNQTLSEINVNFPLIPYDPEADSDYREARIEEAQMVINFLRNKEDYFNSLSPEQNDGLNIAEEILDGWNK